MKKGITPVIAIILLLMVTIAMVGFAFIWFSGILGSVTNTTGTQMTEEQRQMAINLEFINAYSNDDGEGNYNVIASFRNSGTQTIRANELIITIKDLTTGTQLGTYIYDSALEPSESATNMDLGVDCTSGNTIELKGDLPGPNGDVTTFTC